MNEKNVLNFANDNVPLYHHRFFCGKNLNFIQKWRFLQQTVVSVDILVTHFKNCKQFLKKNKKTIGTLQKLLGWLFCELKTLLMTTFFFLLFWLKIYKYMEI